MTAAASARARRGLARAQGCRVAGARPRRSRRRPPRRRESARARGLDEALGREREELAVGVRARAQLSVRARAHRRPYRARRVARARPRARRAPSAAAGGARARGGSARARDRQFFSLRASTRAPSGRRGGRFIRSAARASAARPPARRRRLVDRAGRAGRRLRERRWSAGRAGALVGRPRAVSRRSAAGAGPRSAPATTMASVSAARRRAASHDAARRRLLVGPRRRPGRARAQARRVHRSASASGAAAVASSARVLAPAGEDRRRPVSRFAAGKRARHERLVLDSLSRSRAAAAPTRAPRTRRRRARARRRAPRRGETCSRWRAVGVGRENVSPPNPSFRGDEMASRDGDPADGPIVAAVQRAQARAARALGPGRGGRPSTSATRARCARGLVPFAEACPARAAPPLPPTRAPLERALLAVSPHKQRVMRGSVPKTGRSLRPHSRRAPAPPTAGPPRRARAHALWRAAHTSQTRRTGAARARARGLWRGVSAAIALHRAWPALLARCGPLHGQIPRSSSSSARRASSTSDGAPREAEAPPAARGARARDALVLRRLTLLGARGACSGSAT